MARSSVMARSNQATIQNNTFIAKSGKKGKAGEKVVRSRIESTHIETKQRREAEK